MKQTPTTVCQCLVGTIMYQPLLLDDTQEVIDRFKKIKYSDKALMQDALDYRQKIDREQRIVKDVYMEEYANIEKVVI